MLYSEQLRQAVVAVLKAAGTLAADRVYSPRDWPVTANVMPALLVDDTAERSQSRGNAGFPAFHTTATISVGGKVEGATVEEAKALLATLRGQIKTAVLSSYTLVGMVEQISAVTTQSAISAEARKHVGELQIDFDFLYPEDFEPTITDTLEGMDIHVDLIAPFDATGTYPDAAFPDAVPAAPRTSGPDGRDEGRLSFDFPPQ